MSGTSGRQPARSTATSDGGVILVEEEELGEAARLQQRAAVPAAEPEPARDPALAAVAAADAAVLVVEAAAVAVDEPSRGIGDQLAEGRDPVLEGT